MKHKINRRKISYIFIIAVMSISVIIALSFVMGKGMDKKPLDRFCLHIWIVFLRKYMVKCMGCWQGKMLQ